MGDFEVSFPDEMESLVEYHPVKVLILTLLCYEVGKIISKKIVSETFINHEVRKMNIFASFSE